MNTVGSSGEPTAHSLPGEPYIENIRSTVSDDFRGDCTSMAGKSGVGGAEEDVVVVVGDGRALALLCAGWRGEGGTTTNDGDTMGTARRIMRKELEPGQRYDRYCSRKEGNAVGNERR